MRGGSSSKSTEWSSRVKNEIDKYTTDPPKYEAVDLETYLLIVKMGIGASYGPHRDGNHTLLSKHVTHRKELHNGIQLPTAKEMVVCTTCLCTNDSKGMTDLHHYRGGKPSDRGGKQGKRVSNITVGSCHSHNQSPGANCAEDDFYHLSTTIKYRTKRKKSRRKNSKTKIRIDGAQDDGDDDRDGPCSLMISLNDWSCMSDDEDSDEEDGGADEEDDGNVVDVEDSDGDEVEEDDSHPTKFSGEIRVVITPRVTADPIHDERLYQSSAQEDKMSFDQLKKIGANRLYSLYDQSKLLSNGRGLSHTIPDVVDPWSGYGDPENNDSKKRSIDVVYAKGGAQPENPKLGKSPYFTWLPLEELEKYHCREIELEDGSKIRGIERLLPQCTFPTKIANTAMDYRIVELLLRGGKFLRIKRKQSETNTDTLFTVDVEPRPLVPGRLVSRSALGNKNRRMKHILNKNIPTFIALENLYKSYVKTIDMHLHFSWEFWKWINGEDTHQRKDEFEKWFRDLPPIVTFGSGGSANDPTNKIITAK